MTIPEPDMAVGQVWLSGQSQFLWLDCQQAQNVPVVGRDSVSVRTRRSAHRRWAGGFPSFLSSGRITGYTEVTGPSAPKHVEDGAITGVNHG
jgi:hypothetical protein